MSVVDHPDWVLQRDYTVRCEWGPNAVEALAPHCDVVVIVDVLSFTTAVDISVARGALVFPYRFRDETAARYAQEQDALLAGENPQGYSLKPASLTGIEAGCRLVLPSPNGSTLSLGAPLDVDPGVDLGPRNTQTLAGCLRNCTAVARHAASHVQERGGAILLVPAGERWKSDDSMRPAWEDLCGAGAIIDALPESLSRSPEAEAARRVFRDAKSSLATSIASCASGREKYARNDDADVALAAALDASDCVPVLVDGAYRAASEASSTSESTRSR